MSHIHAVPMVRQLITPQEWEQHDGKMLGDRLEWSNRACGPASLRMLLLAYGVDAPTVTELVKLGVERKALTERGWLHAGLADIAGTFGVKATAEPVPAEELTARLDDAPLIMSVTETFPTDGRRGGHLVVARGYEGDDSDPAVLIRDPSAWGQEHDRVPLSQVTASYSGRAILFPPIPQSGRLIAVLGEMAELGPEAVEGHRDVGQMAAEYGIDVVVAVGDKLAKQLALAAADAGVPEVAIVADNATAAKLVEKILQPGDKVLTKASRSGELWQVAQALTGQQVTDHAGQPVKESS
jgi:hypothetical protein